MSDNKVVLNYDGKSFDYPIVESTIGDRGIDISKLRDQTKKNNMLLMMRKETKY